VLAGLLIEPAVQAQQPWEWRPPAVPGKTFPTKSAAAAAMRAAHPAFANLTVEQGPEIRGNEQVFTYRGPEVPAAITPWWYASHVVRSTYHDTEPAAKEATVAKLAENGPSGCPPPYLAAEADWVPLGYFSPPLSQYVRFEYKSLAVHTWSWSSPSRPCVEANPANVYNFSIARYRSLECQAPLPYKSWYGNSYNQNTGQGGIWTCIYTPKSQVIGNLLVDGWCEGNPCNVRTGDKSQTETDYRSATLTFTRTYHSLAQGARSELGVGWSHNYSDRLSINGTTLSGVVYGSGYQTALLAMQGGTAYYRSSESPPVEVRQDPQGWVLYRQRGERDYFDPQGRLVRRETADGRVTRLVRDAPSGRIVRVEDQAGRALVFEYDPQHGRLRTVTDPAGNGIAYQYDSAGNLVQVDYPDSHSRRYHYEDARFPNALTGITDENGDRFSTYAYDEFGRAVRSEHAGGAERITLQYVASAAGTVTTTVTDALNQRRVYCYWSYPANNVRSITRQCADCGSGLTRTYSYDSGLNSASIRDERGIETRYSHDTVRNLETSRTEAAGTPQARTITTQWHPTFRRPTQISGPGQTTTFRYDAQGNRIKKSLQIR
jgi:YD repeat-containing protein